MGILSLKEMINFNSYPWILGGSFKLLVFLSTFLANTLTSSSELWLSLFIFCAGILLFSINWFINNIKWKFVSAFSWKYLWSNYHLKQQYYFMIKNNFITLFDLFSSKIKFNFMFLFCFVLFVFYVCIYQWYFTVWTVFPAKKGLRRKYFMTVWRVGAGDGKRKIRRRFFEMKLILMVVPI